MSGRTPGTGPRRQPAGPRLQGIHSVLNLRDVGGHATRDGGRVRTGLLLRSSDLNRLTPDDAARFADLGVRTVFDLRTRSERTANPDRLPPATAYLPIEVIGDRFHGGPSRLMRMLASPAAARDGLGNGRGTALWTENYRQFVVLARARAAYGRLFADLADADRLPALVHCTTGKDRTGWAMAALLLLLGVPEDAVMDDFLESNRRLRPFVQRACDEFAARGGDPELLLPVVTVVPAYLEAARDEVLRSFGSIERYFADGLGIDAETQRALRDRFVERG